MNGSLRRSLGQGDDARNAEDVGDLVRVRGHCRRPVRQHGADELVDPELGGLEVHVDIHEGGGERRSAHVDGLVCLARAPTRDGPVRDGKIGRHPFSCAGHEDRCRL